MRKILPMLLAAFVCLSISAQDDKIKPFNDLGVGLSLSTLGAGLEASSTLSKNFKLRLGANYAAYSHGFTIGMDDENLKNSIGYDPDYKMDAKLKFFSGHALIDIHPLNFGIFHFTAGAYIGNNKLKADGRLVNPQDGSDATLLSGKSWSDIQLELDKHQISIENGRINAELELGNVVKPYFGIGIGRSLPKKSRFGFMFELGVLYQGDFKIKQNGKNVLTTDYSQESFGKDVEDAKKWLRWWPMINFQVVYRIK